MTAIRAFEPLATITELAESITESAAVKNDFMICGLRSR